MEIDASNKFFVGVQGDQVVIMRLPTGALSKDDALNLAANIVALADTDGSEKFARILEAIQNT